MAATDGRDPMTIPPGHLIFGDPFAFICDFIIWTRGRGLVSTGLLVMLCFAQFIRGGVPLAFPIT